MKIGSLMNMFREELTKRHSENLQPSFKLSHVIARDQSVTRIEVSPLTGFGRDYVRGHVRIFLRTGSDNLVWSLLFTCFGMNAQ